MAIGKDRVRASEHGAGITHKQVRINFIAHGEVLLLSRLSLPFER